MKIAWLCCVLLLLLVGAAGMPMCPADMKLQWVHVQDASYSLKPYMTSTIRAIKKEIETLSTHIAEIEFGVASFSDKPVYPFGYGTDYCFKLHRPLGPLDAYEILDAFDDISVQSGRDKDESQLDALYRASKSKSVGWKAPQDTETLRVVTLMTDAPYHSQGDGAKGGAVFRPFVLEAGIDTCDHMEYISITDLSHSLQEDDVFVIFIVAEKVYEVYRDLLEKMGRYGMVVPITKGRGSAEFLVDSLTYAFRRACVARTSGGEHYFRDEDMLGFAFDICVNLLPAELNDDAVYLGKADDVNECSRTAQLDKESFKGILWVADAKLKDYRKCYGTFKKTVGTDNKYLGCDFAKSPTLLVGAAAEAAEQSGSFQV